MRIRKKPHTTEKLQTFSDFVTIDKLGEERKGNWRKIFGNDNDTLEVELGTGKGDFIVALAEKFPDKNFIGLEMEKEVVLKAARKVHEKNLSNVRLAVFDINNITEIFSDAEVDKLYINFCDPWPKNRHEKRRLTYKKFLEMYRKILKPGGEIHFKTDNKNLFDFSLEQFAEVGFEVRDVTFDLHANEPADNIRTEYENKFSALGSKINRCVVQVK